MKFDYANFPILEMLDKLCLTVNNLRFFAEDVITCESDTYHNQYVKQAKFVNKFYKNNHSEILEAIKACKDNVIFFTKSKMLEIHQDIDKDSLLTEGGTDRIQVCNVCFIYPDESNIMHTELIYIREDLSVRIRLQHNKLVHATTHVNGKVKDVWFSEKYDQIQHIKLLAMERIHLNLYDDELLKEEIETFGKVLRPGCSIRLPNDITKSENKTKTKITILN